MELYWVIQSRIREAVSQLVHDFPWGAARTDTKVQEQELDRLAYAVLAFAQMRCQFDRTEVSVVDVTELTFRLRESVHTVTRALKLLEKRGLAERAGLPQLWIVYAADLDREPRGDLDSN